MQMRPIYTIICVFLMMLGIVPLAQASSLPSGDGEFLLDIPQGQMRVFTYVPDTFAPDSPVLIVMHGVKRDARSLPGCLARHCCQNQYAIIGA